MTPVDDPGGDPDDDLIAAAVGGDRAAFEALLRRHYNRIHGLAWQMTGSRADADDIAQDVCCTLVTRIGGFRGEAKFTTWLCGIVFNACRDFRRRQRSFGGFVERLAVLAGLAAAPDGRDAYDAIWLKSAIMRMKPAYRDRRHPRRRPATFSRRSRRNPGRRGIDRFMADARGAQADRCRFGRGNLGRTRSPEKIFSTPSKEIPGGRVPVSGGQWCAAVIGENCRASPSSYDCHRPDRRDARGLYQIR